MIIKLHFLSALYFLGIEKCRIKRTIFLLEVGADALMEQLHIAIVYLTVVRR